MAKNTATQGKGKVGKVMQGFNAGIMRSGSAKNVANRKQAVAVAMNEKRAAGARIPKKKSPVNSQ